MLFNSFSYLLFFVGVLLAIRVLARWSAGQRLFLLAASNFFYGYWDYRFLALLWVSIFVDFFVGLALAGEKHAGRRRLLVTASVVVNLGILATFKYFDFFQEGFAGFLTALGIPFEPLLLEVVLPVGISFYTFQSMAYSIDVYRGDTPPCRSLLTFATFVCYFPQLVAGPIERASHLIPQLDKTIAIKPGPVTSGCLLIIWGLFKKVVAADLAGVYLVDPIYLGPADGAMLWLGTLAFGAQIYLDFSGYCDIARGTSRCLGIDLIENFRAPYAATNITEFWRRWHISLSSWFRDYLYIPLGGNRRGRFRTYRNLVITMLLCGLWHGASASFVLWGAFHGAMLLAHRGMRDRRPLRGNSPPLRALSWLLCLAAVTFGWMLFRVDPAFLGEYAALMFNPASFWSGDPDAGWVVLSVSLLALAVAAAHWLQLRADAGVEIESLCRSGVVVGAVAGILLCLVFLLGSLREAVPFIYFQF